MTQESERPDSATELLLIREEPENEKGQSARIRVCIWFDRPPNLEKRTYYRDKKSGNLRVGKAVGFNWTDWQVIMERREAVERILAGHDGNGGET